MSKELDRLEYICKILKEKGIDIKWLFKEDYNGIKQALQRLESIDNANPSEALGILETFENDGLLNKEIGAISYNQIWLKNQIEVLKQALLKAQEQEKVLEIIKEKNVNIASLKAYDLEEYNMVYENKLTQEEFELLKQYFEKNIQK